MTAFLSITLPAMLTLVGFICIAIISERGRR